MLKCLGLGLAALSLNEKPTGSHLGVTVEKVSKLVRHLLSIETPIMRRMAVAHFNQGPTIFPIAFATIVGSALKAIARARMESGIPLGVGPSIRTIYSADRATDTLVPGEQHHSLQYLEQYFRNRPFNSLATAIDSPLISITCRRPGVAPSHIAPQSYNCN
jgi:hypothetical protein